MVCNNIIIQMIWDSKNVKLYNIALIVYFQNFQLLIFIRIVIVELAANLCTAQYTYYIGGQILEFQRVYLDPEKEKLLIHSYFYFFSVWLLFFPAFNRSGNF